MLYHIAKILTPTFSFLNIFTYISVRSQSAFLTSLLLSILSGHYFIAFIRNHFRTKVSDRPPKNHQKKNETPAMGGLFIIGVICTTTLLWCNFSDIKVWIILTALCLFGLIGFFDDLAKIYQNNGHGFLARHKFFLQFFVSFFITTWWYFSSTPNTTVFIPFFKTISLDLGIWIIPWSVFVLLAMSNAVNLTDGLDGLASGILITNFATFSIIAYLAGHLYYASYLFIPFADSSEFTVIGASIIGSLLGFLWYNAYPAQIFMGDVGALSLGATLGLFGIMTRHEILLPLAGGIFFIETLSVILQVGSYKLRKKRIFKMAPIHHHFELRGWHENTVTIRFWIISIVLSVASLLLLKLR